MSAVQPTSRWPFLLGSLLLAVLAAAARSQEGEPGHRVVDSDLGVALVLPDASWRLTDLTDEEGPIHRYGPEGRPFPSLVLLLLGRGGLEERAAEMESLHGSRIRVSLDEIGDAEAQCIEYLAGHIRVVEYGVKRKDGTLVLQIAAPSAGWKEWERTFAGILGSLELILKPCPPRIDSATPEEIRAARARLFPPRTFAIRNHDLELRIHPAEGRLYVTDRFEVEALRDGLSDIVLHVTDVTVDSLRLDEKESGRKVVDWKLGPGGRLVVRLPESLGKGETVTLSYSAHADDYLVRFGKSPIEEVEIAGQVRPRSSFSSHVWYYPIDAANDAKVSLSLSVPKGYTAVTGGEFLGLETEEGWTTHRYEMKERRPRQMPLGFAAAKYENLKGTVEGLAIDLYTLTGDATRSRLLLDRAIFAVKALTDLFGPLPWKRIAVCEVDPVSKVVGVSLPGLVLLSDFAALADELSHQWNFYAAALPGELAEGVSTFTDLLLLERESGREAYLERLRGWQRAYLATVDQVDDVALANPRLTASAAYRAVAFLKPAVVLAGLRRRLGDDRFFAGFHGVVEKARKIEKGYEQFREAFEAASGTDLRPFFDSWFFRAGYPKLDLSWRGTWPEDGPEVHVTLQQVQEGEPFDLDFDIEVVTRDGSAIRRRVALRGKKQSFSWSIPSPPTGVRLDPDGTALFREVR